MPFNGSGTFVSLAPPNFPAVPFTTIQASAFNANLNDIFANGLTKCLTRDGQSSPTANLPMAGFVFTGLGAGTSDTDSARLGQTLAVRGQVGAIDWNTRQTNGIFEATAAALTTPASNFPPTSDLGQLTVIAQGALVTQLYQTARDTYQRQLVSAVWSAWTTSIPRQNFIVNSNCWMWQESTSLGSGTGERYAMDQCPDNSIGVTYTTSRQSWPLGQTDVNPAAIYFKRTVVTNVAGAGNRCFARYPMEGVRTLAGKTVCVSFWAKADAAKPVSISLSQRFGTGGSPSAEVPLFIGKVTLSTTWARYQVTGTLANINGKTLGSNDDDCLDCRLWFNAGSTFNTETGTLGQQSGTFDVWGMKVEEGTFASGFEVQSKLDTEEACYRFYIVTAGDLVFSGTVTSGSDYHARANFRVKMRATPTTIVAVNGALTNGFSAATPVASGAGYVDTSGINLKKTANATTPDGLWTGGYTVGARLP